MRHAVAAAGLQAHLSTALAPHGPRNLLTQHLVAFHYNAVPSLHLFLSFHPDVIHSAASQLNKSFFSKDFYEYAFLTSKYVFLELPFKKGITFF